MSHPISDMFTIIRNATANGRLSIDLPISNLKVAVADVLQREGYIWDYSRIEAGARGYLRINLKYGPTGESVIRWIRTLSRPGRRMYVAAKCIPSVLQGLGICLISTNGGILSGREARAAGVGGEILCEVW